MLSLAVFLDPDSITPVNGVYPAVQTSASLPSLGLIGSINGLLSGVLAYAGLQLFVEFMAEMRRPHDFLKVRMIKSFFLILTCLRECLLPKQLFTQSMLFMAVSCTMFVMLGLYESLIDCCSIKDNIHSTLHISVSLTTDGKRLVTL